MRVRKKPVEVEARQFDGDNGYELLRWIEENGHLAAYVASDQMLSIETLEGHMRVDLRDWVIRGVAGEFYPCKPEIFEATYDEVSA